MQNKKLNKEIVEQIIAIYIDAWVNQDSEKIISIFTEDASYHELVLEKPHIGHVAIRKYWKDKVEKEESDIHVKLLNIYIDGNTVVAEWDAYFFNNKDRQKIHMREVAILEITDNKIKSLREYWHSKEVKS